MSETIIQKGYLGVLEEGAAIPDMDDEPAIEVTFQGKPAEIYLNYEESMVYLVVMESDDLYHTEVTSKSSLDAIREPFYELMEANGFTVDRNYGVRSVLNIFYNGVDNPVSLLKFSELED